jgi:hypothetical protein
MEDVEKLLLKQRAEILEELNPTPVVIPPKIDSPELIELYLKLAKIISDAWDAPAFTNSRANNIQIIINRPETIKILQQILAERQK